MEVMDNDKREISLITLDSEIIKTKIAVVKLFKTVNEMLLDLTEEVEEVPLPNLDSKTLKKILEFAEYHESNPLETSICKPPISQNFCQFDFSFFEGIDSAMLLQIILGANYLNYRVLLDTSCAVVSGMLDGKSSEEIRKTFNIKNDFTPEEEAQVQLENEWCQQFD